MSLKLKIARWLEKTLGGHITIGKVTFYGFNAMHCAVNIESSRYGYICFCPTIWLHRWWGWYFYVSPNATPWASTFAIGPGVKGRTGELSPKDRRQRYGHNFDDRILFPHLYPEVFDIYPQYKDDFAATIANRGDD